MSLFSVLEREDDEERFSTNELVFTLVEAARNFPQNAELISVIFSVMTMVSISGK